MWKFTLAYLYFRVSKLDIDKKFRPRLDAAEFTLCKEHHYFVVFEAVKTVSIQHRLNT